MMRSAVRWLTFHSAASSAAEGWVPERSSARTRASRSSPAYGCGLAGAPGCPACGRRPCPGGGRPRPTRWTASTAERGGPGWPCRRRRARGSSRGGGWRGSRPGWRSAACGRLRRRRPGRPGRRPGRPGSATRSCPAGAPRTRRSTRPRTSSPSGRSARPSPGAPSWPGPGTSHLTVVRGTPRAAMSARLITGRPLIAGIGTTSSRQPHPLTRPASDLRPGPTSGRPGNLSPRAGHITMTASPCPLQSRASPAALMPLGGRSGAPRGQAAGRDLCRGAVRSAALRGGPVGRRTRAVREVVAGRRRGRAWPVTWTRARTRRSTPRCPRSAGSGPTAAVTWSGQSRPV